MDVAVAIYNYEHERYALAAAINRTSFNGTIFLLGSAANNQGFNKLRVFLNRQNRIILFIKLLNKVFVFLLDHLSVFLLFSKLIKINIIVFKSVPYHKPRININKVNTIYFGDGFGCYPKEATLDWYPKKTIDRDRFNMANRKIISLLEISKNKTNYNIKVNQKISSDIRSMLNLENNSLDLKEIISTIKEYKNIIFLSRLAGLRTNSLNEINLIYDFTSNLHKVYGDDKIIIFPHRHQRERIDFYKSLNNKYNNNKKNKLIKIVSNVNKFSSLYGISAESLINIINEYQKETDFRIYVFQSAYFSLKALFPSIDIRFGYGQELINKYFNNKSISYQIDFERRTVNSTFSYNSK